MPRPKKCRRICHFPDTLSFAPLELTDDCPVIVLTLEEYETIRLIDREGFSQEQCSEQMQVARTTIQAIYAEARKKLAIAIVDGCELRISGGDYKLCDGGEDRCGFGSCYKQTYNRMVNQLKGVNHMRVAVTYENGQIFQHFGHTKQFKVYEVCDGRIVSSEIVDTNGSGHGALAGVLTALNTDALICGGIGGGAQAALAAAGIKLFGGVSGDADSAVAAFASGNLEFNPNVQCNHHGEHHHHDHHDGHCGEHGCGGEHHCGNH